MGTGTIYIYIIKFTFTGVQVPVVECRFMIVVAMVLNNIMRAFIFFHCCTVVPGMSIHTDQHYGT